MTETSTPSGSHVSPHAQAAKRSMHPHQIGNLASDMNALTLDSSNSQQSRPNQTVGSSASNTNGTNVQTSPNTVNGNVKTVANEFLAGELHAT